jgi:hypothetical protein
MKDLVVVPLERLLNAAERVTEELSTTMNNENKSSQIELVIVIVIEKESPYSTFPERDGNVIPNVTSVFENEPNFTSIRRSTEPPPGTATDCHEYAIPESAVYDVELV